MISLALLISVYAAIAAAADLLSAVLRDELFVMINRQKGTVTLRCSVTEGIQGCNQIRNGGANIAGYKYVI